MTIELKYAITMFLIQLVFIGSRTFNVRYIANQNTKMAIISGAVVHICWLISIAIGSVSMYEIIANFEWKYTIVVFGSLTGGLIGTYIGMLEKKEKKLDDEYNPQTYTITWDCKFPEGGKSFEEISKADPLVDGDYYVKHKKLIDDLDKGFNKKDELI